jgi:uncharacterized protein
MANKKKKGIKIISSLILLYIVIGIGLFMSQGLFLFHNKIIHADTTLKITKPFIEHSINWLGNKNLSVVQMATSKPCKGLVLYLHGNKNSVERYAPYTDVFTNNGYEVWMPDYPNFGKTTGLLSEENLYKAALIAYDSMVAARPNLPIIIYGKSLGTGLANYTATQRNCQQVILETPYYSIPTLFTDWVFIYPMQWLALYKIPSYQYYLNANKPTTIFHGTNDWVIPYRNAARFKTILKPTDNFITVPNADHININKTDLYLNTMQSMLTSDTLKTH